MTCSGSIRCSTRWCLLGERSSSGIRNPRKRHPATNMLIEVGRWATGREDAPEAYFEDGVRFPEADRHREIWRSLIVLDPKEDGRSIAWCGAHVEPPALCHSFASNTFRLWLYSCLTPLGCANGLFRIFSSGAVNARQRPPADNVIVEVDVGAVSSAEDAPM